MAKTKAKLSTTKKRPPFTRQNKTRLQKERYKNKSIDRKTCLGSKYKQVILATKNIFPTKEVSQDNMKHPKEIRQCERNTKNSDAEQHRHSSAQSVLLHNTIITHQLST